MKLNKRAPHFGAMIKMLMVILIITIIFIPTVKCNKDIIITEVKKEETIEQPQDNIDDIKEDVDTKQPNPSTQKEKINTPHASTPAPTLEPTPINENPTSTATNYINLGSFKITAYCSCSKCCGQWSGGPTASGVMPQAGRTIAVDTNVIPFGTQVLIDGHTYIAEDTGGGIKGNRIDIFFASHQEALNWGIKYKDVSIIK